MLESIEDGSTPCRTPISAARTRRASVVCIGSRTGTTFAACGLACAARRPARACIHIEAAEYPEGKRSAATSAPEALRDRRAALPFCGFCVEACPCDAIRMDTGMHAAPYTRARSVHFRKRSADELSGSRRLVRHPPPAPRAGEASHPSSTARTATAPFSRAAATSQPLAETSRAFGPTALPPTAADTPPALADPRLSQP